MRDARVPVVVEPPRGRRSLSSACETLLNNIWFESLRRLRAVFGSELQYWRGIYEYTIQNTDRVVYMD